MKFAYEFTEEDKAVFLELIYDGYRRDEAARELDSTGSQFRKLTNIQSEHYDPDFAEAYKAAVASDDHDANHQERIRDLVYERAKSSDRLTEKLALIHLPEWDALRHTNFHHDVQITARVQRVFPHLSREEIDAWIASEEEAAAEAVELRALPPAESDAA